MKGDSKVISKLNKLLTFELAAVDQYLVQSRVLEDWGYSKLFERFAHESDDERGHVTLLIQRILFLEGAPDVGTRAALKVGKSPAEMLELDLEYELEVAKELNEAIALCRDAGDNGTRAMLEEILNDTERDHILWLQQQLHVVKEIGAANYLQQQL